METKICIKCKKEKPYAEFSKNKSKKDGYQSVCKECMAFYNKMHYINNKEIYIMNSKKQTQVCKEYIKSIKENLQCARCGEKRFWVLDFHHINSNEKENDIATLVHNGSIKKLKLELEKCTVLCANCHRDEHYRLLQHS